MLPPSILTSRLSAFQTLMCRQMTWASWEMQIVILQVWGGA